MCSHSITLSVAGIFKEVVTISFAVVLFGEDKLTTLNVLGLLVSICGIGYYNYIKYMYASALIFSVIEVATLLIDSIADKQQASIGLCPPAIPVTTASP